MLICNITTFFLETRIFQEFLIHYFYKDEKYLFTVAKKTVLLYKIRLFPV